MFAPKSRQLTQFESYLATRRRFHRPKSAKLENGIAALGAGALSVFLELSAAHDAAFVAVLAATCAFFGYKWFKSPPLPAPTPNDAVLEQADAVANKMAGLASSRQLHRSLHPGIAATLNECAGFWRRIEDVCRQKIWDEPEMGPHWKSAKDEWRSAADFAMAEALVLADGSLTMAASRSRAEEIVEDVLDTFVYKRPRASDEPLPTSFAPLRDLAEKLRAVTVEVEGAARRAAAEGPAGTAPDASRRLEDVLGKLRAIQQAEEELRQDVGRQ